MDEATLQAYLHEHIPMARAMQISVLAASPEGVTLGAPLEPNINHRGTLFGGSASSVAILAAWSLVRVRLAAEGIEGRIVIFRNTMHYDRPVEGDFTARSRLEAGADWPRFMEMLGHMGMARIAVASVLDYRGKVAGRFSGQFVALADNA